MVAAVNARTSESGGVVNFASGSMTNASSAVAVTINLGFVPRYVKVFNETDILIWERSEGMAATHTYLITGSTGAVTVTTASDIVFDTDTGLNKPGKSFTLSATLAAASKVMQWVAFG